MKCQEPKAVYLAARVALVACPHCDGSGEEPGASNEDWRALCTVCAGRGEVTQRRCDSYARELGRVSEARVIPPWRFLVKPWIPSLLPPDLLAPEIPKRVSERKDRYYAITTRKVCVAVTFYMTAKDHNFDEQAARLVEAALGVVDPDGEYPVIRQTPPITAVTLAACEVRERGQLYDARRSARADLLTVSRGEPFRLARTRRALELLNAARELLKAADCPKTVQRVRLAVSSCKGAIRHAEADPYREARLANRATLRKAGV